LFRVSLNQNGLDLAGRDLAQIPLPTASARRITTTR
jgi:hypothetical protein